LQSGAASVSVPDRAGLLPRRKRAGPARSAGCSTTT